MKNILNKSALFFLVLIFFSCSSDNDNFILNQEANEIESLMNVDIYDDEDRETAKLVTTTSLKAKWEGHLRSEGVEVELGKFEILKSETESGVSTYFLKAVSTDGTIETGAFLTPILNTGKASNGKIQSYSLNKKTCECTGCPNGCSLQVTGTLCRCSGCPIGGSQNCVKKETVVIEDIE